MGAPKGPLKGAPKWPPLGAPKGPLKGAPKWLPLGAPKGPPKKPHRETLRGPLWGAP